LVRHDPDGDFGIRFPDVPGCISVAATPDYANGMALVIATGFVVLRMAHVTRPAGWQIWAQGSDLIPVAAAVAARTGE